MPTAAKRDSCPTKGERGPAAGTGGLLNLKILKDLKRKVLVNLIYKFTHLTF